MPDNSIFDQCMIRVINGSKSADRLSRFKQSAAGEGVDTVVQRLEAEYYHSYDDIPDGFKEEFLDYALLMPSEIGCYASHLKACREFLESEKRLLIVFEDDVVFRQGARQQLIDLVCWFRRDVKIRGIDVVHLGVIPVFGTSLRLPLPDNAIVRLFRPLVGGHALMLTRNGAEAWLKMRDRVAVDVDLWFRPDETGLWPHALQKPIVNLHPALSSASTINTQYAQLQDKRKRKMLFRRYRRKDLWGWRPRVMLYALRVFGGLETLRLGLAPVTVLFYKHLLHKPMDRL